MGMGPMHGRLPPAYACKATDAHLGRALVEITRAGPVSSAVPAETSRLGLTIALCLAADAWAQRA